MPEGNGCAAHRSQSRCEDVAGRSLSLLFKQRILGERGHLSNENSGKLLCHILHDKLQAIVLGHLSKENNLPELAYEAVRMEITMGENPYRAEDFRMMVADRSNVSPVINIA